MSGEGNGNSDYSELYEIYPDVDNTRRIHEDLDHSSSDGLVSRVEKIEWLPAGYWPRKVQIGKGDCADGDCSIHVILAKTVLNLRRNVLVTVGIELWRRIDPHLVAVLVMFYSEKRLTGTLEQQQKILLFRHLERVFGQLAELNLDFTG